MNPNDRGYLSGELKDAIVAAYGSVDAFKDVFAKAETATGERRERVAFSMPLLSSKGTLTGFMTWHPASAAASTSAKQTAQSAAAGLKAISEKNGMLMKATRPKHLM